MIDPYNPPPRVKKMALLLWLWAFISLLGMGTFIAIAWQYPDLEDIPTWAILVGYGAFIVGLWGFVFAINEFALLLKEVMK